MTNQQKPESLTFDDVVAWLTSLERTEDELEHLQHIIATFLIVSSLGGESESEDNSCCKEDKKL